jgi:O-acetyl-ADP-ribose deacetylase (regulator of RNase III)
MAGVEIIQADITALDVDVIVNSANPSLLAGGGVCGAIHAKAGPELERASRALGPISPGESVITPGYNLMAKYVIHSVAPIYASRSQVSVNWLLRSAYESALALHDQVPSARSIAFPSMGTGIYGWPLEEAAGIAVKALRASRFERTLLCAYSEKVYQAYKAALGDV